MLNKSQSDRPSLSAHLPRDDMRLDMEHQSCPCCGGALHLIGETVSEMLDHVPARLRVIRIRRPRYGCRACGTIHQAPAPERPIAKGLATPGLLAHVLVSKYCDHFPLNRQSQIFARQGVELDRPTANWVGGGAACGLLRRHSRTNREGPEGGAELATARHWQRREIGPTRTHHAMKLPQSIDCCRFATVVLNRPEAPFPR